jgi:pyruvate kinase
VATIGPASASPEQLVALVDAGMDVARLGFAHGSPEEHLACVRRVREAAESRGRPVAVLADLPGPKVRTGAFVHAATLQDGALVRLVSGDHPSDSRLVAVDYPGLLVDVAPGDSVRLGDGAVVLRVEEIRTDSVVTRVENGGTLQGRPGVHLPSGRLSLSAPTETDLELLERCLAAGVDLVAVSFVRRGADVRKVREAAAAAVGAESDLPLLVAKIETPVAVDNLAEIVEEADAVMVARGDLGTECPLEDVPHLQKRIVRACMLRARPVITATQMLESMTHAATPTRAEASDVANAVLDGTDALMLSGETAVGHDPAAAVRTMARIAGRAEREADDLHWAHLLDEQAGSGITEAITHAAWRAARDTGAAAILCCTWSGNTVRALSRFRPTAHLIGLSPNPRTVRRLSLTWGASAMALAEHTSAEAMVDAAVEAARDAGYVAAGDVAVVLAGGPHERDSVTDVLRLVRVR